MAATAPTPPVPPCDLDAMLQVLVRHFDRDAAESRKQIRELMDRDPDGFYSSALGILRTQGDSRGCQYLVTLFVAYGMLWRALSDPALSKGQALVLARAAARVDSLTEVSLAKSLAESCGDEGVALPARHVARLMEVLCEISDGSRIQPSLMRLLRHPDPHLRSKVVKMIGRASQSVRWVQNRLKEADPRIRANAIESLWGLDSPAARELFQYAGRDANNRVAGNALLGLYRLGDSPVIPDILQMAEHESALFRSTAAWVMGETGDPRFSEALARLMRDPSSAVRSRSLSALGRIKNAVAQSHTGAPWIVTALPLYSAGGSKRHVSVGVAREPGQPDPHVLPTQFIVSEGGRVIQAYRVQERPTAEAISVVFAMPREMLCGMAWQKGVQACRARKRSSDLWAIAPYLTGEGEEAAVGPADEPLLFSGGSAELDRALSHPPPRTECIDLWRTVLRAVRTEKGQIRGKRHVILVSEGEPYRSAGDGLVSTVVHSGCTVQVIASRPNPKVESFCRRAQASFQLAEDGEAMSLLETAYLHLLARYEISWHSDRADSGNVRIRVAAPSGWGETEVAAMPVEPG